MADPNVQRVRKANGQIVETVIQGTDGQPVAPALTPAGAAAQGQSPDQAKMTGTPAQKAPILREAQAPGAQTLEQAQRLTPPAPNATPADQQAAARVGSLLKMGSYGTKLLSAVQAEMSRVAPTATPLAITADPKKIKDLFGTEPAKEAAVTAAVNAYLANRTDANLQAIKAAAGWSAIDANSIATLTTTPDDAISGALKSGIQGAKLTIGELDLSTLGIDGDPITTIARDLGLDPEVVRAMTPQQLQQAVQDVITRDFSQVAALRVELKSASPNRKAQILDQLRALDATGRAGVEASVQDLADQMAAAQTITIGDTPYELKDIFSDDGMSKLVLNAVTSQDALDELIGKPPGTGLSPALGQWIIDNRAALQQLVDDMAVQGQTNATAQTHADALMGEIGIAGTPLAELFEMPVNATPEQLAAWEAKVKSNPLYLAAKENKAFNTILTDPNVGPALVEAWKDLTPGQVQTMISTSDQYDALTDDAKAILKAAGIEPTAGNYLTDPVEARAARDYMAVLARYPAVTAAEVNAVLDGLPSETRAAYARKGNLNALMKSMDLLKKYPIVEGGDNEAGKALRALLGLGAGATYMRPGAKDDNGNPIDIAAMVNAFAATNSAVNHAGGTLLPTFYSLLKDGTLGSVEDLQAVAKTPGLLTRLVETNAAAAAHTKMTKQLGNADYGGMRNTWAQTLVPGVKSWEDLYMAAHQAAVVSWSKRSGKEAKRRADEFLGLLKKAGLDVNNDGKVDSKDFSVLDPRDGESNKPINPPPTATRRALTQIMIAMRDRGVGDETKDTVLGGTYKPSTLPKIDWGTISTKGYFDVKDPEKSATQQKGEDSVAARAAEADATEPVSSEWKFTGETKPSWGVVGGKPAVVGMFYKFQEEITYKDGHKGPGRQEWRAGERNGKGGWQPPGTGNDSSGIESAATTALGSLPVPKV